MPDDLVYKIGRTARKHHTHIKHETQGDEGECNEHQNRTIGNHMRIRRQDFPARKGSGHACDWILVRSLVRANDPRIPLRERHFSLAENEFFLFLFYLLEAYRARYIKKKRGLFFCASTSDWGGVQDLLGRDPIAGDWILIRSLINTCDPRISLCE